MSQDAVTRAPQLSVVRSGRTHLRRSCQELEGALSAPLVGREVEWSLDVATALTRLRESLASHVALTEGDGGLFEQVRTDAPRLEAALRRLHGEHLDLTDKLAAAGEHLTSPDEAGLARARSQLTQVLALLSRHRQRGADLLYQAYQVDIGGE
jgi:hypothetical protein